jgi:hypothetical protein
VLSSPAALASLQWKWDYVFFDERFEQAHRFAASLSAAKGPIGVRGDVTPFWSSGLDRLTHEQPLRLRGLTTDSFQFCLRILVAEHANLDARVSRVHPNLFSWIMHTTPKMLSTDQTHA